MSFPEPAAGQVIQYSYLWKRESDRGQEEGVKNRPCAVVLSVRDAEGRDVVTVLPVTHTPPSPSAQHAMLEIAYQTKIRLGLDSEQSWIVLTEANRFVWPGPDLRMRVTGDPDSVVCGHLPARFYRQLRDAFLAVQRSGGRVVVEHSE